MYMPICISVYLCVCIVFSFLTIWRARTICSYITIFKMWFWYDILETLTLDRKWLTTSTANTTFG